MKRLITILVVSVLSVISTNSSAVAVDKTDVIGSGSSEIVGGTTGTASGGMASGGTASGGTVSGGTVSGGEVVAPGVAINNECKACEVQIDYIQSLSLSYAQCNSNVDKIRQKCQEKYSSDACNKTDVLAACRKHANGLDISLWCQNTENLCEDEPPIIQACGPDCNVGITLNYGRESVEVVQVKCGEETDYKCVTETKTVAVPNDFQGVYPNPSSCVAGTCKTDEWNCSLNGNVLGCTNSNYSQPYCACVNQSDQTSVFRLECTTSGSTGKNCNGAGHADDDSDSKFFCSFAKTKAGSNPAVGLCKYKKTCSTDCTSTNAWNVVGTNPKLKLIMYRLKGSCDYETGSCVSNGGTVASDFDYKCNHDNRAYETGTVACSKINSKTGKPTSCSGCTECSTSNGWETASNSAYQQQYHYNFSPKSGTDKYQCTKVMDSQYQCSKGYYGNPGSSMTGCNACPTLASSGLTIVNKNENCSDTLVGTGTVNENGVWQDAPSLELSGVTGATTISQCYAMTGNQEDNSFCGATLNDGSGTFYWYDDYISGSQTVCFYQ